MTWNTQYVTFIIDNKVEVKGRELHQFKISREVTFFLSI